MGSWIEIRRFMALAPLHAAALAVFVEFVQRKAAVVHFGRQRRWAGYMQPAAVIRPLVLSAAKELVRLLPRPRSFAPPPG